MADNENKVLTPEFRVSFPNVFKPAAMQGGEPKYSLVMLFPKGADLSALKALAERACTDKFGEKSKWPKNLRSPFRDQGEKEYDGYEEGAVFISASNKLRPGLVDQNVTDIISEEDFYAGCYARATVRAYGYDQSGNRGIAFSLENIQKLRDGEPLGSRRSAPSEDFAPVENADTSKGANGLFD